MGRCKSFDLAVNDLWVYHPVLKKGYIVLERSWGPVNWPTRNLGRGLYQPPGKAPNASRRPVRPTAIPYYAWGNRGIGSMRVWIPRA